MKKNGSSGTRFRTHLSLAYSSPIRVASFPRSEFSTHWHFLYRIDWTSPSLWVIHKHCRARTRWMVLS